MIDVLAVRQHRTCGRDHHTIKNKNPPLGSSDITTRGNQRSDDVTVEIGPAAYRKTTWIAAGYASKKTGVVMR
jgi:hypothetical protein